MKKRGLLLIFMLIGVIGCVIATLWLTCAIIASPQGKRAWTIVLAFDQLGNATTGGSEDETISSRTYRLSLERVRWAVKLRSLLDWLDEGHCKRSSGI